MISLERDVSESQQLTNLIIVTESFGIHRNRTSFCFSLSKNYLVNDNNFPCETLFI